MATMTTATLRRLSALAACLLWACGGMNMKGPQQGLFGTFTVYAPPSRGSECATVATQSGKDSCSRASGGFSEEPYRGAIVLRNLATREKLSQPLDEAGSYRIRLEPGEYEVCVNGECSDPIEVHRGKYTIYGQRLPKAMADSAEARGPGARKP